MPTHYETLGVPPAASTDEIRQAYIKLAETHHPDKGGSEETMSAINMAYTTLKNDRKAYTIYLDMTMGRCPKCKARGLVPSGFTKKIICPSCKGSGYILKK
jgi:DnaJ-class molecular chaperone